MSTRYVPTQNDDVRRLLQAVNRSILDQRDQRAFTFGDTNLIITDDANVGWGFNRVNALDGALSITLPSVLRKDIGKTVTIANVTSSTNTVTILPQSATINGETSASFGQAYGLITLLAADTDKWLSYQESGSWASSSPRWDYLNTTGPASTAPFCVYQFDQSADSATNRVSGGSAYDLTFGNNGGASYTVTQTNCTDELMGQGFNKYMWGYSAVITAGNYPASTAFSIEYIGNPNSNITTGGFYGGVSTSLAYSGAVRCGLYCNGTASQYGGHLACGYKLASPYTNDDYMETVNDFNLHYMALTYSGTDVNMYVDGELTYAGTLPSTFTFPNLNLYHVIGAYSLVGTTMYGGFSGSIYSVRYTAAELSASEIATAYTQVTTRS